MTYQAFALYASSAEGRGHKLGTVYKTPQGYVFQSLFNSRRRSRKFHKRLEDVIPRHYSLDSTESEPLPLTDSQVFSVIINRFAEAFDRSPV